MEDWLKPEHVKELTQLVLPGFLIAYVRARILPVRRLELKDAIFGYLALSFFYQALLTPANAILSALAGLFAPIGPWIFSHHWQWLISPPLLDIVNSLRLVTVSIVIPVFVGLMLGLDATKGWTRAILAKYSLHLNHSIETAWDWRLGQEECWVHVKLKDGTKWAGHLGKGSFSSTDPTERDLYLDAVYDTGHNDENWTSRSTGVWIAHGEIQTIEFWPEQREQVTDG